MDKYTTVTATGVKYNNEHDEYHAFEDGVKAVFEKTVTEGKKLFKTNAEGLFEVFLDSLPKEARQYYNCNSCRHFINRFGGLVTIDDNGKMTSVMWDVDFTPSFFKNSVSALKNKVMTSKVKGVFVGESRVLGQPMAGGESHLSVTIPRELVSRSSLLTAGQVAAEMLQDFKILTNALLEYSIGTVDKALTLLNSEALYRSDRVLGNAEWFKKIHVQRNSAKNSTEKTNIVWLAVATAPTGFTHIKNNMIGTLLDDISSGLLAEAVARRFAEKMNPSNYMRSTSAPTQNSIVEAEKIVEKLGIANSLARRYATLEEIPSFLWKNSGLQKVAREINSGVFGSITPKEKINAPISEMALPSTTMTWDKFKRTVMPTADNLEVLVDNPNRFMALVTAADETAENILQWNNPFSWYYHGGVDGEIKRRVEDAGGRYENNEIRVSLIWEGLTDLDLHCVNPRGEHIYYSTGSRKDRFGGYLDLDMNGMDKSSQTPVENMRWSSNAPEGRYKFYVHNYSERVNQFKGTPFKVEMEINGKTFVYHGQPLRNDSKVTVFEFDYVKGQQPNITNSGSYTSDDTWTIQANNFVKVNGITTSPNLWDGNENTQSGNHVFFLLDGVKDTSEGKGRGFFNEMLKPELRQIRKTLEAFTKDTPIEDAELSTACGIGYNNDSEWNLTVKVTANNSTRIIKIDRWD